MLRGETESSSGVSWECLLQGSNATLTRHPLLLGDWRQGPLQTGHHHTGGRREGSRESSEEAVQVQLLKEQGVKQGCQPLSSAPVLLPPHCTQALGSLLKPDPGKQDS